MGRRWSAVLGAAGLCIAALGPTTGLADWKPNGPIKIYVGFGPGSSTDILTRVLADRLAQRLGQPVVVENRVGATGTIASDAVARSRPDGTTLIMLTGAHATTAAVQGKLPYKPIDDFSMVSLLSSYGLVVSVRKESPIASIDDLIAQAKANPGKITFASGGYGSGGHMIGEMMNADFGIEMLHVPMRAGVAQATEVLSGRIDLMIEPMAGTIPHVRAGTLRPIAVTATKRESGLPDVPTLAERKPGVVFDSFNGIAAAANTPPDVVDTLQREIRLAVENEEVRKRMVQLGVNPIGSKPDEMRAAFAAAIAKLNQVVDARKLERR